MAACGGEDDNAKNSTPDDSTSGTASFTVTPVGNDKNGSISPSQAVKVDEGASTVFTITANPGFIVASIGGTYGGSYDGATYTTKQIKGNCTVEPTFSRVNQTFKVTPSLSGQGGTIFPMDAIAVSSGSVTTFTVEPDDGYVALVEGTCGGELAGSVYTTHSVDHDCSVVASFKSIGNAFTVTPSVMGTGGALSPSMSVVVEKGASATFSINLEPDFSISSLTGSCGGAIQGNTIITNPIASNCTVEASFSRDSALPLSFVYQTQLKPSFAMAPETFLALLITQGAKGYFLQDEWGIGSLSIDGITVGSDGSGRVYSYELLAIPDSLDKFIAQANAVGANGYRYEEYFLSSLFTDKTTYLLYRKDNNSTATYTYVADAAPVDEVGLIKQANAHGQSGYLLQWNNPLNTGTVYVKSNASGANYTYNTAPWPESTADLLSQFNTRGSEGYPVLSFALYAETNPLSKRTLFVKDQSQKATFSYKLSTTLNETFIDEEKKIGSQGFALLGEVAEITPSSGNIFFLKSSNCTGALCSAINPALRVFPLVQTAQ